MPQSYFLAHGNGRYLPTDHAGGAWSEDELHLAAVSGLVTHHLEQTRAATGDPLKSVGRIAFDALGRLPVAEITIETRLIRPGRTIELWESTAHSEGRAIIAARAWALIDSDTSTVAADEFDPMPPWEESVEFPMADVWDSGFVRTAHVRHVGESRPGRTRAWIRTDYPLVDSEPVSDFARFVGILDLANGIAAREQPGDWIYPNVALDLNVFRRPVGEWVGYDTRVSFGPTGHGLTSTVLHDTQGAVGTLQQYLTLRPGAGG